MNKKNGTKIGAVILMMLLIVPIGAGASVSQSSHDAVRYTESLGSQDAQFIDLDGSITANVENGSGGILKSLVYPTIDIPGEQTVSINTTLVNDTYMVNTTLRIYVNKPVASNTSYIIPRKLTVLCVVVRKNQPLISGLLSDLILGRSLTKMNIYDENVSDYIEIPLEYEAKEQNETQRVFILAIGSLVGVVSAIHPIIAWDTVDLTCQYSETEEGDIIPPFTQIILTGLQTEANVFDGSVVVELQSIDNSSTVVDTQYQYILSDMGGVYTSGWMTYNGTQEFTNEGDYEFQYYSQDSAGNIEPVKSKKCTVRA